jgi:hypothetical protein
MKNVATDTRRLTAAEMKRMRKTAGHTWSHYKTAGHTWPHYKTAGHTWPHYKTAGHTWPHKTNTETAKEPNKSPSFGQHTGIKKEIGCSIQTEFIAIDCREH